MSQGTDYEIDEVDQENPPKEFLVITIFFRFFLHNGLVASFCPRLAYSFHSRQLVHTIRSARHEDRSV